MFAIPKIFISGIPFDCTYKEFINSLQNNNNYNAVFEMVNQLLDSGISSSMIFAIANQEISIDDFCYINKLSRRLLFEPLNPSNKNVLLNYSGKYIWTDALAYYLVLNETSDELILGLQKFCFALLIEASKHGFDRASLSQMNNFLARMANGSTNDLYPAFAKYTAKLSEWIRVFSRPFTKQKSPHIDQSKK